MAINIRATKVYLPQTVDVSVSAVRAMSTTSTGIPPTVDTIFWLNRATGLGTRNATTAHTIGGTTPSPGCALGFTPTSGRLLVAFVSGAALHTSTGTGAGSGWTEHQQPVNSAELSFFTKTAVGNDFLTVTHNGSNYPINWAVYEFEAGTTYINSVGASTNDDVFPTLSGLPGTPKLILAAYTCTVGTASGCNTVSAPWIEDSDSLTTGGPTDNNYLFMCHQTGVTATSVTPVITFGFTGTINSDRQKIVAALVPAVTVQPTSINCLIAAAGPTANTVTLDWDDVAWPTGSTNRQYEVHEDLFTPPDHVVTTVTVSTRTSGSLQPGTYRYHIVATDSAGTSAASQPVTVTVPMGADVSSPPGCVLSQLPPGTADQVSQYGITWTFDQPYPVGQFVNGDWWVVGPVTVTSVSPAPSVAPANEVNDLGENQYGDTGLQINTARRNGSMVVMSTGGAQGYDSRGITYSAGSSLSFPYALAMNRSMISSVSNVTIPNTVMHSAIMWTSEQTSVNVMKTAAVLTCLPSAPPANAFRPAYVGGNKQIFTTSQINWDQLLQLPPPPGAPSFAQYERYLQRPWIDHMDGDWPGQWLWPMENMPAYGREFARIVGTAALLLNTNATQTQKQTLLYRLIQYGIDIRGLIALGATYDVGGGHASGRKWPAVFAGLMLEDPSFFPNPSTTEIQEDTQTYYGPGWYGQKALWQMIFFGGTRQPYQHKPPAQWTANDDHSDGYRECCTIKSWIAQALATLLMGAKAEWDHNAYFENVEDWMRATDIYAAGRLGTSRPGVERTSLDAWVDSFWATYRGNVPAQPDGVTNLKWDVNLSGSLKWVNNPRP